MAHAVVLSAAVPDAVPSHRGGTSDGRVPADQHGGSYAVCSKAKPSAAAGKLARWVSHAGVTWLHILCMNFCTFQMISMPCDIIRSAARLYLEVHNADTHTIVACGINHVVDSNIVCSAASPYLEVHHADNIVASD